MKIKDTAREDAAAVCGAKTYFDKYEALVKSESWGEILRLGKQALSSSVTPQQKAVITAQLTSTCYYKGDYTQALEYVNECHALSEHFEDCRLYLRALYLESAVYRAREEFTQAVEVIDQALAFYKEKVVEDSVLLGKIYFNRGAAHADDPDGDLEKAKESYELALQQDCPDADKLRTYIRLGKVHLLNRDYEACQKIINDVRPQIQSKRVLMHCDYLEAQLLFEKGDYSEALRAAKDGLNRATDLGAAKDQERIEWLISQITSLMDNVKPLYM